MEAKEFTAADTALAIVRQEGLDENETVEILKEFQGYFQAAKSYEQDVMAIVVTDESQTMLIEQAREKRLEIRKIRIDAERTRVRLKEKSLREGRAIDGIGNIIKAIIVPMEEHLLSQENFVERLKEERVERVHQERIAALTPYVEDVTLFNLKDMTPEGFTQLLESSESARKAEADAEREAEEKKAAEATAAAEKQKETEAENARLKEEAEIREAEAVAAENAAEANRIGEEKRRKEAEQELADKIAAEELELKKEEDVRAAKEEEVRQAELAPEKIKLVSYAKRISMVESPSSLSDAAMAIVNEAQVALVDVALAVGEKAKSL